MANYMSDGYLSAAALGARAQIGTIQIRLHSGAPGNAGTANRIGTIAQDIDMAGWGTLVGLLRTLADTSFGVLSGSSGITVRAWSGWDGTTFLGWGDVYAEGQPGTVGQLVAANEAFRIAAGEIAFELTRP